MKVIAFLSGRGSNFKSLLEYSKSQKDCNYEVVAVFSDKPSAEGLIAAEKALIPVHAFSREKFPDFQSFKAKIFQSVASVRADLIVLAGFMQIVPAWFIKEWSPRIINIHPSLLPKFPGLHTHERVLQEGHTSHGCTVHVVDDGVDTGPIISQAQVEVLKNDTPESLAARVLEKEHALYPWVVDRIGSSDITLSDHSVSFSDLAKTEAAERNFLLPL